MLAQVVVRQARFTATSHLSKSLHSCSPALAAMESSNLKTLTIGNLNPNLVKMEYAVRGPLVIRATAIEKELQQVNYFIDIVVIVDWKLSMSHEVHHEALKVTQKKRRQFHF